MASLNAEAEAQAAAIPSALADGEPVVPEGADPATSGAASNAGAASKRGEEARGGFVLRAKSDEYPRRRRSLVERSGMKNLVQVRVNMFPNDKSQELGLITAVKPFFIQNGFFASLFFKCPKQMYADVISRC